MKKWKITHIVFWTMVILLFLVSTAGYLMAGEVWYDATYYSAQLFFMNFTDVEDSNALLYLCRLFCPIMTATGMVALVRDFFRIISDGVMSKRKDATAIYSDMEQFSFYKSGFRYPVWMGNRINRMVKSHVLMFENDIDNLTFFERMEKNIKEDSKVYIKLEDVESKLLKKSRTYYFNINEMIARMYWNDRNLEPYLKDGSLNLKIAIIGFDSLGQNLLDYGLMNNVYSLDQHINYHVWGDSILYRNVLGQFDMMNGDTITYHDNDWKEDFEELKAFDRIIVEQEYDVEILQALLYLNNRTEIDYYNPNGTQLAAVLEGNRITSFGVMEEVLTEENIKTDKLYRMAKMINYSYLVKTDGTGTYTWNRADVEEVMEEKWRELSGFHKGSNVACADYHKIRLLLLNNDGAGTDFSCLQAQQEEALAQMEHTRWCRYHFVNHWHYDKVRNNEYRKHNLLVPYSELPHEEQQKALLAVKELLEMEK